MPLAVTSKLLSKLIAACGTSIARVAGCVFPYEGYRSVTPLAPGSTTVGRNQTAGFFVAIAGSQTGHSIICDLFLENSDGTPPETKTDDFNIDLTNQPNQLGYVQMKVSHNDAVTSNSGVGDRAYPE